MVRMTDLPEQTRERWEALDCPTFSDRPWIEGPPLRERRVAIVSSAGLHRRGDSPFRGGDSDYRVIPSDTPATDIIMSHVSINYDRTAFHQDLNTILPLDRLREMAEAAEIGSMAANHYVFMGATDPREMETEAQELAGHLRTDSVDAVLLLPV